MTKKYAFTLIEILIVVAIIGIVAAIAMPAYMRAREISWARGCQENLAKIEGAMVMEATEQRLQQGSALSMADLIKENGTGYLRSEPKCPKLGTYSVTRVGADPTCSIGENEGAEFAPHIQATAVPASN